MAPLTPEQTRNLESLLIDREQQLSAEIATAREASRQRDALRTQEVVDRKADATDEASIEVEQAETERDLNELKAVQTARRRLDAGLYGRCIDCEEPIALQRLLAQPSAIRCAGCQAGHEERASHKH